MNILITICARGGSKGIPGKNIKNIGGRPLIAYTIETAKSFSLKTPKTTTILSTDSLEIKDVAKQCGLDTDYIRPDYLAQDATGKIDAIKDVLLYSEQESRIRYDFVLDMDVTAPLRNVDDLEAALSLLISDEKALNIFSVSNSDRSPYFNMVEKKDNGYYTQVKQSENALLTRQSAPVVYSLNASFYIYRRSFFDLDYKGAITDRSLVYRVPHMCFDLDHPIDFEFMSYLIENDKLDFKL